MHFECDRNELIWTEPNSPTLCGTNWTEMNWTTSSFAQYSPCNATELNWIVTRNYQFSSVQFIYVALMFSCCFSNDYQYNPGAKQADLPSGVLG